MFLQCTLTLGQNSTPESLAELQLKGYNNRDIELFLSAYSDTVKVFSFPDRLLYKGKETMKVQYENMFSKYPDLNCTVVKRMILGDQVIDEEEVVFIKGDKPMHAIAIYKIAGDKITAVYFLK